MKALIFLTTLFLTISVSASERPVYFFKNQSSFNKSLKRHYKVKKPNEDWTWERWQLALWASQFDQPQTAIKLLGSIEKSHKGVIATDLYNLNLARFYFQSGKMSSALKIYQKIDQGSDFWLTATEEMAWAEMHKGLYDQAIGRLTTLTSPVFGEVVPAETYFTMGIANLRICDYKRVFSTTKLFKKNYLLRVEALTKLAQGNDLSLAKQAFEKMKSKEPSLTTVGHLAKKLPLQFWRDRFFLRHWQAWQRAKFTETSAFKGLALERVRAMAQTELNEISQAIQNLHILEAEAIQRMYVKPLGGRVELAHLESSPQSEQLHFPNTDEVWLDELDSYKADVKDCPTLRRAAR